MTAGGGKRYKNAVGLYDVEREYQPAEAFNILKRLPDAKFD